MSNNFLFFFFKKEKNGFEVVIFLDYIKETCDENR